VINEIDRFASGTSHGTIELSLVHRCMPFVEGISAGSVRFGPWRGDPLRVKKRYDANRQARWLSTQRLKRPRCRGHVARSIEVVPDCGTVETPEHEAPAEEEPKGDGTMDDLRKRIVYHLPWTRDRKIEILKGPSFSFLSRTFILIGPREPVLPEAPLTRHEFYTLLSELAGQGFLDNLLDFGDDA
jgi:hypothetical protein